MHRTSNTLYEDAMIAATAKVHKLTVVTRNVKGFKSFGVGLVNPFVAVQTAQDAGDYFRSRVARADLPAFNRIMSRAGGEPPHEGDER